jgi:glycosyltransferase involved in cell wall biosynthesis
MKILINDYAGHSFTIQLARQLSKNKGINVIYTYFSSDISPKGNLAKRTNGLEIYGIGLNEKFQKYSFFKRRKQELIFSKKLIAFIFEKSPDIVICANTPIEPNYEIQRYCKINNIRYIFWLQDIISIAVKNILKPKFGIISLPLIKYYESLERRTLAQSDHIITISNEFINILQRWNISDSKISLLKNWADTTSIYPTDRNNSWSKEHKLTDKFCIMYSGTLGLKHNPYVFLKLSKALGDMNDVIIVVITEGIGAEIIDDFTKKYDLKNIIRLPYQPFERMAQVLSSSDVLIAILEENASVYSVPSKILSYMCVGRPIVASINKDNLSHQIIALNNCGLCVNPNEDEVLINCLKELKNDKALRAKLGSNGFAYARQKFDIIDIANKFIKICSQKKGE